MFVCVYYALILKRPSELYPMAYAEYVARKRRNIENHLNSPDLAEGMREELRGFFIDEESRGVSVPACESYIRSIGFFGRWLARKKKKSFKDANRKDLDDYLFTLKVKSDSVKSWCRLALKVFYRWLLTGKTGKDAAYPEIVATLRVGVPKNHTINESDLITPDEFARLLNAAGTAARSETGRKRVRALLFLLYETGARIGELLEVKRRDVRFDDSGTIVYLPHSKTIPRPVPVLDAIGDLKAYMAASPRQEDNAPLFVNESGQSWDYAAARMAVKRAAKTAGITKRVHLHLFRHVAATADRKGGMNDDLMRIKYGWSASSKMVSRYGKQGFEDVMKFERAKRGIAECGQGLNAKAVIDAQKKAVLQERVYELWGTPGLMEQVKEIQAILANPELRERIKGLQLEGKKSSP